LWRRISLEISFLVCIFGYSIKILQGCHRKRWHYATMGFKNNVTGGAKKYMFEGIGIRKRRKQ